MNEARISGPFLENRKESKFRTAESTYDILLLKLTKLKLRLKYHMSIKIIENKRHYAIAEGEFGEIYFGKIYRFMNIEGIINTFNTQKLRFKSATELNDVRECNLSHVKLDDFMLSKLPISSKKELFISILTQFIQKRSKQKIDKGRLIQFFENINFENDKISIQLDNVLESFSLLINKELKKDNDLLSNYLEEIEANKRQIKICSFSRNYKNKKSDLMWGHYADGHRGACIELDYTRMIGQTNERQIETNFSYLRDNSLFPFIVDYNKVEQKLDIFINPEQTYKWVCIKSPSWKYEQEVRMIAPIDDGNIYTDLEFPKRLLSKIIFGAKTSQKDINRIIKIIESSYDTNTITFEQIYFDDKTDRIKSKNIKLK